MRVWEERFDTGLSASETDQWLDLFKKADEVRAVGTVDWDSLEAQNNRVSTTQFVVPLIEGCSQKDAWALKRVIGSWLKNIAESQVHGQALRSVMEAPPSQEARRRAGGRAYGVLGTMLKKVAVALPALHGASIHVQWGTPLEVYVRGLPQTARPVCVATWKVGDGSSRDGAIEQVFGEEVRPAEILAALRG